MQMTPKNWVSFQHYKNRLPPWIKLHRTLLDDRAFQCLPVASRALAPMLWLLASESENGEFNGAVQELAFRLRQSEKEIDAGLKPLISNGFFILVQDASKTLASCQQVAPESCSEREREGETEKETERETKRSRATIPEVPESLLSDWAEVRKSKHAGKITETVIKGIRREADKAGISLEAAITACCEFGWQGFRADWYAERVAGRKQGASETPYQRSMREKMEIIAPSIAARAPGPNPNNFFDVLPSIKPLELAHG